MAHKHRYMKTKIGPFQELPHGRLPGQKCVPREDYPEIVRRAKDETNSAIGLDYGVAGQTIGRIVRRAGK